MMAAVNMFVAILYFAIALLMFSTGQVGPGWLWLIGGTIWLGAGLIMAGRGL